MVLLQRLINNYQANEYRIFLGLMYLLSAYGIYRLFVDVSLWWLFAALVWSKFIGIFGHSIGLHRYFSHRSFNTTAAVEKFLAWTSVLLGAGSPVTYARTHRHHHRHADTPADYHSPVVNGRLSTMLGAWEFRHVSWFIEKGGATPRDLLINKTCKYIHDNYFRIWSVLLIASLLVDWRITVYLLAIPVLYTHLDYNILTNTVGHGLGYRNFETNDASTNCSWTRIFNLGESYHNNHHAHPQLYDFAVKSNEYDLIGTIIKRWLAVDGNQTRNGKLRIE